MFYDSRLAWGCHIPSILDIRRELGRIHIFPHRLFCFWFPRTQDTFVLIPHPNRNPVVRHSRKEKAGKGISKDCGQVPSGFPNGDWTGSGRLTNAWDIGKAHFLYGWRPVIYLYLCACHLISNGESGSWSSAQAIGNSTWPDSIKHLWINLSGTFSVETNSAKHWPIQNLCQRWPLYKPWLSLHLIGHILDDISGIDDICPISEVPLLKYYILRFISSSATVCNHCLFNIIV